MLWNVQECFVRTGGRQGNYEFVAHVYTEVAPPQTDSDYLKPRASIVPQELYVLTLCLIQVFEPLPRTKNPYEQVTTSRTAFVLGSTAQRILPFLVAANTVNYGSLF